MLEKANKLLFLFILFIYKIPSYLLVLGILILIISNKVERTCLHSVNICDKIGCYSQKRWKFLLLLQSKCIIATTKSTIAAHHFRYLSIFVLSAFRYTLDLSLTPPTRREEVKFNLIFLLVLRSVILIFWLEWSVLPVESLSYFFF